MAKSTSHAPLDVLQRMRRILLIDDDESLLEALSEMIRIRFPAAVVRTAHRPSEALEAIVHQHYHLVLCDFAMPEMNGLRLLTKLRELTPDSKVIIMTAHGDETTSKVAMHRGAAGYVEKPFDRDSLAALIEARLWG